MSEFSTKRRVVPAMLLLSIGLAGCSKSANRPRMAVPGEIMQCQASPKAEPKSLAQAGYGLNVVQELSRDFNAP